MALDRLFYRVEVDWVGGAGTHDITADVISLIFRYGKAEPQYYYPLAPGGVCTLVLNDSSGIYNPANPLPPLPSELVPGSVIGVYMGVSAASMQLIWEGRVDTIIPHADPFTPTFASMECVGALTWLARALNFTYYNDFQERLSGDMVNVTLNNIDWAIGERAIDPGQSRIRPGALIAQGGLGDIRNKISVPGILRTIAVAEFGTVRESHDNKIVFEDRYHRIRRARSGKRGIFTDDKDAVRAGSPGRADAVMPAAEIGQIGAHYDSVINVFESSIVSLHTIDTSVIVDLAATANITLDAGEIKEFTWELSSTADYLYVLPFYRPSTATDMDEASGLERYIEVDDWQTTPQSFSFTLQAARDVVITRLEVRGRKVDGATFDTARAQDSVSIAKYDKRSIEFPSPILANFDDADDYCRAALSIFKDPKPGLTLAYHPITSEDTAHWAANHRLSDVIEVECAALGIERAPFFIESIQHQITNAFDHVVTYQLSGLGEYSPWMAFGASTAGGGTAAQGTRSYY